MKKIIYLILLVFSIVLNGCLFEGKTMDGGSVKRLDYTIMNNLKLQEIYYETETVKEIKKGVIAEGKTQKIGEITSSEVSGISIIKLKIYTNSSKEKLIYSFEKNNEKDREKMSDFRIESEDMLIFNMTEDKIIK